jgi:abortive infection bacteriophage resistance protein
MNQYPKRILSLQQQVQTYIDSGMNVPSRDEAVNALTTIGYYRLRGYCHHLYDNRTKQYQSGTNFSDVILLYRFDAKLSHLIFSFLSSIEVSLRARLIDALLIHQDALILNAPVVFDDKKLFWRNLGTISSEIVRSNDVFIKHNFSNHDGQIPLWATVEIMSFGTLSKTIKNLKTGPESAYSTLAEFYKYRGQNGNMAMPTKKMLSSWIHAATVLRNMCAHNSRIYNRSINTTPELIFSDRINPQPRYNGLYQILLAMKYLRPTDKEWNTFVESFKQLVRAYDAVIDLNRMNFPSDWATHFTL